MDRGRTACRPYLEMERAPGLAPGKSGVAIRRFDDFSIARILKWSGVWELHPSRELHRLECFGYTTT